MAGEGGGGRMGKGGRLREGEGRGLEGERVDIIDIIKRRLLGSQLLLFRNRQARCDVGLLQLEALDFF
jgi:hypothetical protein